MKKYIWLATLLIMLGCQEIERGIPVSKTDGVPPPVTDVQVENIPGGANITYALPKSESMLYVLAVYSFPDSANLEKKSSYYNNSLTIEGFPDTNDYQVELYTVSRGGKKSDPVPVKINPLTSPVTSVFRSVTMQPTFGGVHIDFVNKSKAKVKISVLTPDSLGDLSTSDIFYTQLDSGGFSVRGYDSIPRKFGVFVRDRWNNYSDTVFQEITPFYEQELDKSKFREVHLPTDTYEPHTGFNSEEVLWDDVWDGGKVFHTKPGSGIPQWFTFDLGVEVRLSRFKFFHRSTGGTDGAYYAGDPKVLEVWGSDNPNPDGSWDNSWVLLGHFQSIKPSGQAKPTTEDLQYACVDGEDFEFPIGNPPVRYLRIKILKNWGGLTYMYMSELTFWGSVQ